MKILKTIISIIKVFITILLIAFVLVVCLQRFSDNKISFLNYRMFTVVSGSMKPKYDIGDVLIAKEIEASKIKEGDTISYLGASGDFTNKVITHQVIDINKNINGEYIFTAKGLANLVEDPLVHEDQLYGVVVYRAVILSLIYRIISTEIGFYLFIIIPILFIIGSEFISSLMEKEGKRRNKTNNQDN